MNNSNIINFNLISYVLILEGKVLMTKFGKKKRKLSIIVITSSSICLKIVQNLLGVLYTLVHLTHFPCTVNVIPSYNDANSISLKLCVHVGVLIMFSMVWLRKWWMT